MNSVVIFGAGKIGRGFIGQLFHRSGWKLYFFDVMQPVVDLLDKEKKYRVEVSSVPPQIEYIPVERAFGPMDAEELKKIISEIGIIVTSVGANNIASTVEFIKPMLKSRTSKEPLNWMICENADKPGEQIRSLLLKDADDSFKKFVTEKLGLVETQVLRTGMLADPDVLAKEPLAVRMQNWWTLPLDKDAFKGPVPDIKGFQPKSNFGNELQRKVYTFNGTNGPISYVGWINGHRILHEAALSPEMKPFLQKIQEESAHGLVHEFKLDPEEHKEFQKLAMQKYTDPSLNDQIERNASDSKRKLAPRERLIGPAVLCMKYGKKPEAYAIAIAAAFAYNGSDDAGTKEVQQILKEKGIEAALEKISGIKSDNELSKMVAKAYNEKKYILKK
jgi:mannitol-1-phosphate 5-dehydrogenase